jgi:uncharacterized protein YecE (DUF72 family)
MELYIGTSGWYYDWNGDKTLDWYIAEERAENETNL